MSSFEDEEVLTGGNVSNVYRSGDTVRRELKSDSHKFHKLLKHLENKGFSYAPKFLGIDEKGREVLSFIEGEAGNYPLKKYMWSDDVLIEIGKMLRLYHDSVSDFSFDDSWKAIDNTPKPFEILCHNDFAIYNIIFKHERPVRIYQKKESLTYSLPRKLWSFQPYSPYQPPGYFPPSLNVLEKQEPQRSP
ncbi:Phosphotransferase enzyme family protein [Bacillus megaterium]|jgi:hypothetical protein|uniref:Trifolitoxin immunity protein n=1 Tax=Priestia megaterium (strain ATCC 12872 / QMB1551) TaxID=545693 RepID=D5E2S4_PRIM1|nr:trifolitoxin immunity protein [Priestia megaterium QM B1551]MDH6655389.1 hypothetical protein [Bacillus sp. PvP124]MUL30944.1 Phosphotransferase enzyme family protein [Priestia megaterium]QLK07457.1 trifolitoxin immunity domain protein [Priestia megaterium]